MKHMDNFPAFLEINLVFTGPEEYIHLIVI
jgi:hypothetical protein